MKLNLRTSGWSFTGLVLLLVALGVLWLSGIVIALGEEEFVSSLRSSMHAWVALHGIAAWVMTLIGGRYAWGHIALCWRRPSTGAHRNTGWFTLIVLIFLAGSGLWLMYGPADGHESTSSLHWWLGLFIPGLLMLHLISRRTSIHLTRAWRQKT